VLTRQIQRHPLDGNEQPDVQLGLLTFASIQVTDHVGVVPSFRSRFEAASKCQVLHYLRTAKSQDIVISLKEIRTEAEHTNCITFTSTFLHRSFSGEVLQGKVRHCSGYKYDEHGTFSAQPLPP